MSDIKRSAWLAAQPVYPFVKLRAKKRELLQKGVKVIDFSIGDPSSPTPDFIIKAASEGMERYKAAGYPDNKGALEFRKAVAGWYLSRFGVELDPEYIFPSLGAKEAIFSFPNSVEGEYVIVPTPGYPPYYSGTLAAGKKAYTIPLLEKNRFLPDLSSISEEIAKKSAIIWINYPNNPTTVLANPKFYRELVEFCKKYEIIIASDECYSEMYQHEKPDTILNYTRENVIVFNSFSKRSNMTGWRVGHIAGDPDIVKNFLSAKENMDSGCANFIQHAAVAALQDEEHVVKMRAEYEVKREIMNEALVNIGLRKGYSDGTFYIWQPLPEGVNDAEFAEKLLSEEFALVVTPGTSFGIADSNGFNPGAGFVRFALTPSVEDVREAAKRISKLSIS